MKCLILKDCRDGKKGWVVYLPERRAEALIKAGAARPADWLAKAVHKNG